MFKFTTLLLVILSVLSPTYSQAKNRIAIVQMGFEWGDTERNIEAVEHKIESIEGCDMILLPELFISGCDMRKRDKAEKEAEKIAIAKEYPETVKTMQQWAKQSGAVIVGSTIYQQGDMFYNRLIAAYPSGETNYYDKHNCFKMGSFSPGEEHLVIEVNSHRFATYICYDLRFSDWSQNQGRYDSAIYIANWPESRGEDWSKLLRERAIENKAHVIGVNCVGEDLGGTNFMGDSSLYNTKGELVAKCESNKEQILIVEY